MKMADHATAAFYAMNEIRDFTQDIPSSSDRQLSKMTQDSVDSLSLVENVLYGLDNLLGIVSVSESDKDWGDANRNAVSVHTASQINGEICPTVQKPPTCTVDTQTSDDLMSDSISAMETQLLESHCKLDVMTEYYKSVEVDFRNAIGRHTHTAEKAKADLETSRKQMAELQTKLVELEMECRSPEAGDAEVLEAEYRPENTQAYRPRPRKNFEIREHYFVGETPPPAWARINSVCTEQTQVEHPARDSFPPPPYNQGYNMTPPPPLHRPCSAPGLGRIPPPPQPFGPRRCRSELNNSGPMDGNGRCYGGMPILPPPPPPGSFMAPPPLRAAVEPPQDTKMEVQCELSSPRPGDFVVRPMSPCGMEEGQKVRFGVRQILYI